MTGYREAALAIRRGAPFTPEMARGMSESTLQTNVLELAATLGWRRYHTHDSRRSIPGFPDLCLVNAAQDRCVFIELKTERGRVTAEQTAWGDDLSSLTYVEYYLIRPRQWLDGTVKRVLLARPA